MPAVSFSSCYVVYFYVHAMVELCAERMKFSYFVDWVCISVVFCPSLGARIVSNVHRIAKCSQTLSEVSGIHTHILSCLSARGFYLYRCGRIIGHLWYIEGTDPTHRDTFVRH